MIDKQSVTLTSDNILALLRGGKLSGLKGLRSLHKQSQRVSSGGGCCRKRKQNEKDALIRTFKAALQAMDDDARSQFKKIVNADVVKLYVGGKVIEI